WASNTRYLAYGAELDRNPEPWRISSRGTATGHGAYTTICTADAGIGGVWQAGLGTAREGELRTGSAIARSGDGSLLNLRTADRLMGEFVTGAEWKTYSATLEMNAGDPGTFSVFSRLRGCVDAIAAWLTKTATPGRACWGGEAPVHCDAGLHTISTEGWPTTEGELSITYTNMQGTWSGESIFIADGSRFQIKAVTDGRIRVFLNGVPTTLPGNPAWRPLDQVQHIRAVLSAGSLEVFVNGVSVGSVETGPNDYSGTARIGSTTTTWANGSIRFLRIRNYKEVSP